MGRIVCDSEGHLNASSVLLEGTLQHSQGHSVKLDLSQLPSYRLFPGQVNLSQLPLYRLFPGQVGCMASPHSRDCLLWVSRPWRKGVYLSEELHWPQPLTPLWVTHVCLCKACAAKSVALILVAWRMDVGGRSERTQFGRRQPARSAGDCFIAVPAARILIRMPPKICGCHRCADF